jgi:hypothetical protein
MNLDFLKKEIDVTSEELFGALIFFVLGLVFIFLLFFTMNRWGDLIVDTFRDFNIAIDIMHGKVLYRDVFYEYGLLPPHVLSLVFSIFGAKIHSAVALGATIAAFTAWGVYRVGRFFLDQFTAAATVIGFFLALVFGHYTFLGIFNFILPYSLASTMVILFITWSVFFFIKFIFSDKLGYLWFWVVTMFIAFLCRIELSSVVWFCFFITAWFFRSGKKTIFFFVFLPVLCAVVVYWIFFAMNHAYSGFLTLFGGLVSGAGSSGFVKGMLGTDNLHANFIKIRYSFFAHLIFLLFFAGACSVIAALLKGRLARERILIYIASILGIGYLSYFFNIYFFGGLIAYSGLAAMFLIAIPCVIYCFFKGIDARDNLSFLVLILVSLVCLARIIFNIAPYHYGFYLMVPAIIAYSVLLYKVMFFWQKNFCPDVSRIFVIIVFNVFLLSQAFAAWSISFPMYGVRALGVNTEKGVFYTYPSQSIGVFWQAVAYISENTKASDTVDVVPEGYGINFFSQRQRSLPYTCYQPDTFKIYKEMKIIEDFNKYRPGYIVMTSRDCTEFGARAFGVDYAKDLYAWILDNYTNVKQFGSYPFTSGDFGIVIFKRKDKI